MTSPHRLFIPFLCALLAMACTRRYSYPPQLVEADSMTIDRPDSAITMLERLSPEMDNVEEHVRMYYRLLKIKAEDRAYRPITGDTAITAIVEYYENGGDRNMLPKAYYYAGRINKNNNNYPQALAYFQKSVSTMKTNDDTRTRTESRTYSQMGYIFSYQCLYDNALNMFRNALECNTERKDTTGMIFDLRDIADAYKDKHINDSALYYYKQALNLSRKQHNGKMEATVCAQLAWFYHKNGEYDTADKYLQIAVEYDDPADRSAVSSIAADIYWDSGNLDSAISRYEYLTRNGTIYAKQAAHQKLSEYYADQKNPQMTIQHFRESKTLLDSIQEYTVGT